MYSAKFKMNPEQVESLPDYWIEINRARIRFSGIGPRYQDASCNKIWPRDTLEWTDELRKILYDELRSKINNVTFCDNVGKIVERLFKRLKQCNITSIFQKFCPLDKGHFEEVPFAIHHALDCYTPYKQILAFIHQTLRAINAGDRSIGGGDFLIFLFGCHRNYDIFKSHLSSLVSEGEKLQKIPIGNYVHFGSLRMDLNKVEWLGDIDIELKYRLFIQIIYSLIRFILDLLRRYFYITLGNHTADMLLYYRYDLWQKIQSHNINDLIKKNIMTYVDHDSQIPYHPVAVSKLRFHLKRDSLRPICIDMKYNQRIRKQNRQLLAILKGILQKSSKFSLNGLLRGLRSFKSKVDTNPETRVYMVRTDIKNCFQSVDQRLLKSIVLEKFKELANDRDEVALTKLECHKAAADKKSKPLSFNIWSIDPERVKAERNLLDVAIVQGPVYLGLNEFDKRYLTHHVCEPVIRETRHSRRDLMLLKGLRQGSPYSPLFCSIYIEAAFERHLNEFFNSETCKIYRYVDDILFISLDLDESRRFMDKMLKGFKDFNLKMNVDKLSCNFRCLGLDENLCKLDDYVVFYKLRIAIKTLECSHHYVFNDVPLQYSFHINAYFSRERMVKSIKAVKVNPIHLDCELNNFDRVVENIFYFAILLAHRTGTAILQSFELRNLQNQAPTFVSAMSQMSAKKIHSAIRVGVRRDIIKNDLTLSEIRLLAISAFLVTWKRVHMRHRKSELKELERIQRRFLMRVTVIPEIPDQRKDYWVSKNRALIDSFNKGPFIEEVTLPQSRHRLN